MTKKWGAGIIGLGRIGQRHAEEISKHPGLELVGYYDTDPTKKLSNARCFSHIEELLADPEIHVVHVCTPNGSHYSVAKSVLNAQKHVVIEKPVTLFKSEAQDLQEIASSNQRHVFCVMQNRYSPVSTWLKGIIDDQKLGKIYSVRVDCAWNRDYRYYKKDSWHGSLELDGGPLYTQFSHFVDMLYWLFGEIHIDGARFFNHNHPNTEFEDSGVFDFHTSQFSQGSFQYTTSVWDKNYKSSIQIIGEKGSIEVSGQYMNEIQYCHIDNYTLPELEPTPPPNNYDGYQGSASNHVFVIHNVWETLSGISSPKTTIQEGKMVTETIENVYNRRK